VQSQGCSAQSVKQFTQTIRKDNPITQLSDTADRPARSLHNRIIRDAPAAVAATRCDWVRKEHGMKLSDTGLSEQELKDVAKTYMIETYERYDFVAERAEGMYLYDPQGNAYLDFYGGIAVNNAGNCNPKVVAALREQVSDIMHTFNYPYTIPQVLLAKQVCEASGFDKIFFQNSGTEANEVAIKLARKYGIDHFGKHKFEILSALNSFHGRTFGSLAAR
jgi:acetylornithine/N-succinyldiaminopimelate aminotransferase